MFEDLLTIFPGLWSGFKAVWFIILPVGFHAIFYSLWGRYVFLKWIMNQDDILLEVFPPKDIERSPQTMENFFYYLHGSDKGPNVIQKEIDGYVNPVFSLELVGTEGTMHFYIRTHRKFRELVESGLYAQYPGVEIEETEDYSWKVPRVVPNKEWTLWGVDYKLQRPDAYPIRTYKHFEEDITGKMIDPLHTLIEGMSILGPGQHIWLQFIINAERPVWNATAELEVDRFLGRESKSSSIWGRVWKDILDVIGGIFTGWNKPVEYSPFEEEKSDDQPVEFRLTPGEKQTLTALEDNVGKAFFNVKMRLVVVGKKEGFTKANVSAANGGIAKPFNDTGYNTLIFENQAKTDAEHIFKEEIIAFRTRMLLERYRDRDGSGTIFHMSTEELATLFHLPDMSVVAPGVQYVGSKSGGAPSNLPFT